jgi:hypothetical protein
MNVMPHPLLQNIANEERRNMSKRILDTATDSNGSRMPFDSHFKAFELPLRDVRGSFEFLRIRSNALERTGAALDA